MHLVGGRGRGETVHSKEEARNGGPCKGAAGRGKELGQKLRIAGSGAKGWKGQRKWVGWGPWEGQPGPGGEARVV